MAESERRLSCPVCQGVELTLQDAAPGHQLMLDRCSDCGGIWFDAGEVEQLRSVQSPAVWREVMLSDDGCRMSCHGCRCAMDRNAAECPACGWQNILDCPACARAMQRWRLEGLVLDYCLACLGVWFDRIELAEIWNLKGNALGTAAPDPPDTRQRPRMPLSAAKVDLLFPDLIDSTIGSALEAIADLIRVPFR